MAFYKVTLYDNERNELGVTHDVNGLRAAKQMMRSYLTDREYVEAGAWKVEVTDDKGNIIADEFW